MRRPEEISQQLHTRFARDYPSWARGHGSWPWRISLNPPSTTERARDPIRCHEWASVWADYTGPGRVEYATLRFPTGAHRMPKTLVVHHPGEVAAAHADDRQAWRRCGQRLTQLERAFPTATFRRVIRRITELTETDYQRLRAAATWLHQHPTSGMLLRQLPIEGIDTKWLAHHAALVLALLDQDDASAEHTDATVGDLVGDVEDRSNSRRRALHARLGLRVPPELVQVSVCDARLRTQVGGMRHFAASVEDLNRWELHPGAVAILENKETAYAVTEDLPSVVILHGHGSYVEQYGRITWVQRADRVIYWGDLDLPGIQFASDLRALGIAARTILTDTATLNRFRRLAVEGAKPQRATIPAHLTSVERELYVLLVDHAEEHGTGLLLEQEKIPWPVAAPHLYGALSTNHMP